MQALMILVGILAWAFAVFVFGEAKSAIHEIEALISALIGTVAFAGAGMMGAIDRLQPARIAAKEAAARKEAEVRYAQQQAQQVHQAHA